MSTYSAKAKDIVKNWVLIDAEGLVVGRLATIIANRCRNGFHFTPSRCARVRLTPTSARKLPAIERAKAIQSGCSVTPRSASEKKLRSHEKW